MNDENFLDFLSDNHQLPTFNLPTDAVPFIARSMSPSGDEKIEVNMSTGLEQALTQYAPGKELVVRKKTYRSGGLYIDYPPRLEEDDLTGDEAQDYEKKVDAAINRFALWFERKLATAPNKWIFWHHRCSRRSCQHTLDSVKPRSQTPEANQDCEMCHNTEILTVPVIRPPGFGPLVNESNGTIEDADKSENQVFRNNTKWPAAIKGDLPDDQTFLGSMKIRMLRQKELININPGRSDIGDQKEHEFGFAFCRKCGALEHERLQQEHRRPYSIPFSDVNFAGINTNTEMGRNATSEFNIRRKQKCDHEASHEHTALKDPSGDVYSKLVLGRLFTTDIIVFRIPWNTEQFVGMDPEPGNKYNASRMAAETLLQALLNTITTDDSLGLNIEDSDIDGDVRRYRDGDEEGWDVFIFERSDGGIGLLDALFEKLKKIVENFEPALIEVTPLFGKMWKILRGDMCTTRLPNADGTYVTVYGRPCRNICSGCILDYTTQYMEHQLDRTLGFHLYASVLFGGTFQESVMPYMADDQLALCQLLKRHNDHQDAEPHFVDESLGEVRHGLSTGIELRKIDMINSNNQQFAVHSPLLRTTEQNSFSRTDLYHQPMKILQKLSQKQRNLLEGI
jgi:hypothetical protein